jgi:hypothetical protein
MAREKKNKVIVWRPFPSPTKRDASDVLNPLESSPEESQRQRDQAEVNRWTELADILNGNAEPKQKKKGAA